jgi:hypothetical protein
VGPFDQAYHHQQNQLFCFALVRPIAVGTTTNMSNFVNLGFKDFNDSTNRNNEILSCENCKGIVRKCRFCGQTIEILNHNVTNFAEGTIHRCARRRGY